MTRPREIDFPTSEVWSQYYASRNKKSPRNRYHKLPIPDEKNFPKILANLRKYFKDIPDWTTENPPQEEKTSK